MNLVVTVPLLICISQKNYSPFFRGDFLSFFFFFLEKSDERFDTNQIHKSDTEAELKKVKTLQLDSCS